jgi:CheY-like chemotaxis protein
MHEGKMWLESELGVGTTFFFSLPVRAATLAGGVPGGARRWITPYHQPEVAFHRSKAPAPDVSPRYVLLERGGALQRLFSRYNGDVEVVSAGSIEDARQELNRSPAQGLVINAASLDIGPEDVERLNLPFVTPVVSCWIAGDDQAARKLGVVKYLIKPINRERLLHTLDEIGRALGREVQTVLLVDDQAEVLQLFARMLTSTEQHYVVLRARGGRQALELLRERKPDVVLLDLVMPEVDGFQVIAEKNRDETIRDIPVVVVSSRDPTGAPVVSSLITIGRTGGISARELLGCIRSACAILAPEAPGNPNQVWAAEAASTTTNPASAGSDRFTSPRRTSPGPPRWKRAS